MDEQSRRTHLRIDFVVREVCDDGSVGEDDLRFIRFGDDVETHQARDFFDRCGHAMTLMFKPGTQVLSFIDRGPNKIEAIKLLREFGSYGLKEAKDYVEAPSGTPFLIVPNHVDVDMIKARFKQCGAIVEARGYSVHTGLTPSSDLAPLQTYKGKQP